MLAFSCPLVFAQHDHPPLKKNMEYVKCLVPIMPGSRSQASLLKKGVVEGWLHYCPQEKPNFRSEGLADLHICCCDGQYNVVLGFLPVSSIF